VHWHPHLHVLVTDGVFARDGTFTPGPAHDAAVLEEAWRRAVPGRFVAAGWWKGKRPQRWLFPARSRVDGGRWSRDLRRRAV
jgi:hypothetical protein